MIAAMVACSPPRWVPITPTAADNAAAAIYTADGRVLGVERNDPDQPATYVRVTLDLTGHAPVQVELAPGWYLDEQGLTLRPNERLVVEGKKMQRGTGSVIVARRVRKGAGTYTLRDDADRPLWH